MRSKVLTHEEKLVVVKFVELENKKREVERLENIELALETGQPYQPANSTPPVMAIGQRVRHPGQDFRRACIDCGQDVYKSDPAPDDVPTICDVCMYERILATMEVTHP